MPGLVHEIKINRYPGSIRQNQFEVESPDLFLLNPPPAILDLPDLNDFHHLDIVLAQMDPCRDAAIIDCYLERTCQVQGS
jgi:hypothetical protein